MVAGELSQQHSTLARAPRPTSTSTPAIITLTSGGSSARTSGHTTHSARLPSTTTTRRLDCVRAVLIACTSGGPLMCMLTSAVHTPAFAIPSHIATARLHHQPPVHAAAPRDTGRQHRKHERSKCMCTLMHPSGRYLNVAFHHITSTSAERVVRGKLGRRVYHSILPLLNPRAGNGVTSVNSKGNPSHVGEG